jgi:toxin ParE1/3/4
VKVVWSQKAEAQLRAIHAYLAQGSENYALRVVDRITYRTKQIAQFPRSGRVVADFSEDTIRELIEAPYRIIYEIRSDRIVIAAVVHSRFETGWR